MRRFIGHTIRSSHSLLFFKIGVLKNFAIFTGKRLSFFLIKSQAFRPANLLKKTPKQVFSCEYRENFKNNFFIEHLISLHLNKAIRLHF